MGLIKDMVTLRLEAMKLATQTIATTTSFYNTTAYDVNNHLAIAKAIEKYIKGDAALPEIDNPTEPWKEIMEKMQNNLPKPAEPKAPNFEVKE